MGEVEFFDRVKKINRLLSNDARTQIWEFILNGEFILVKSILKAVEEGKDWEDVGLND